MAESGAEPSPRCPDRLSQRWHLHGWDMFTIQGQHEYCCARLSAGSLHNRESRSFHKMLQVLSTAPGSKPRPAWLWALLGSQAHWELCGP